MRNLTIILLLAAATTAVVTGGLLRIQQGFSDTVRTTGGQDEIHPDLFLFYYDISEEDLREENPEGFARLAAMEFTPARTEAALEWSYRTRLAIFQRRHGRPYTGRRMDNQ